MEERVPPPATATDTTAASAAKDTTRRHAYHRDLDKDADSKHDSSQFHHESGNNNNNNHHLHDHHGLQMVPSDCPTQGAPMQTFIVQIPKDQIYRIPPPEHAQIVARYRNPDQNKRRCPVGLVWCGSVFLTLALLATLIACVRHFTLNPQPPTFSIKHLVVKQPPGSKRNGSTQLDISVDTRNPNRVNDVVLGEGSATLSYKYKEVAKGHFPAMNNVGSEKADGANVVLEEESKDRLLEKPKSPVGLLLRMTIPVKMKTWMFDKNKEVKVDCRFNVNSLGDNAKVVSQSCG